MWMFDKNIVANTLKGLKIPYVVTSHGAYTKDKIKDVWWKKIPAKYAYELNFLNKAAAIHAICFEEMSSLREFGVRTPIFVVPNGIELAEIPNGLNDHYFQKNRRIKKKIKFLWIGNLKPCKNLDSLILAVSVLPKNIRDNLAFIIIGPEGTDAKGYLSYLKKVAINCGVHDLFHFIGPQYGKDKYEAIVSSDIYIHPSLSEVISFSVLEYAHLSP